MNKKLTSKEAKAILKVSDCKLMHLREEGKIQAPKKGISFLYDVKSIERYKEEKKRN